MKTMNCVKVLAVVASIILLSGAPARATETDDRIEASARQSYVFKTYLKDDAVRAQSKDGVVTLTGTVKEESHKGLAEETVAGLPGVTKVDNQLVYSGEKPVEESDAWISMKIKSSLLYNRNVSGVKTQVFVQDGIVTLRGEADNQAQKDLAGEYAQDIKGVKAVKNEMTIAQAPAKLEQQSAADKIDDASITAQVKMALWSHRSTSAFKTGVDTDNGIVTISGKAGNGAEKDLVTKVASDVKGVKQVVNNMTIDDSLSKN